eukprot:GGOE01001135.1.p1 GENE.GGOE01001135.1~~GGOE01001135.1.p1  ORF type:complete len:736 (+),score=169.47 GGOE01001135.1:38-2245(+)
MRVVVKRNGAEQPFDAEKVVRRCTALTAGLDGDFVSPEAAAKELQHTLEARSLTRLTSQEVDELLAESVCYLGKLHPDYLLLAGRISSSNLHKRTHPSFAKTMELLHHHMNPRNGQKAPLVSKEIFGIAQAHRVEIDGAIAWDRDFQFDYFAVKTLENSYLLKIDTASGERRGVERPQHMLMRVALGIWGDNIAKVLETYEHLSQGFFIPASPTLYNAGASHQQLASSFLVAMKDDSIDGIYDTLKHCAVISRRAGGIGLWVHNIRAKGAYICGTNGVASGLPPMLRIFNDTAYYVDRGGKQQGAFAVYVEPWHADIFEVLQLRQERNSSQPHALSYALWVPDLFMRRVEQGATWSLFCPVEVPDLADVWGEEFVSRYERYEALGKHRRSIRATDLWFAILQSQIETGGPCMLYKDACNQKSNHQHLGAVKGAGLCCEVVGFNSADETLTSVQASIALPRFVACVDGCPLFDHDRLRAVTKLVTQTLNRIVDINCWPTEESRCSSLRHRPIGIGVQGLADTFLMLRLPFTSSDAQQLNQDIFETIYFAALEASCDLAQRYGPYDSYGGSPSSAAKILGNAECFDPIASNVTLRRLPSGEVPIINRFLVQDLVRLGRWNEHLRDLILAHHGSVSELTDVPESVRELYRTAWELKDKALVDMAVGRAMFIDQSSSATLFVEHPTPARLTSLHFYAWKRGLKTGMYTLCTQLAEGHDMDACGLPPGPSSDGDKAETER